MILSSWPAQKGLDPRLKAWEKLILQTYRPISNKLKKKFQTLIS